MQKFQDVLDGKIKVEELTPEEMSEFVKFGKEKVTETLTAVGGVRDARQAEEKKLGEAKDAITKAEATIARADELNKPALTPEMQVFRNEQVEKAKNRLLSTVKLTPEQQAEVMEKFKKLDSGKMDADFIYKDLIASVAATQPDRFLTLSEKEENERIAAEEELARQAGGSGGSAGGDNKPKKFTDEATKLAKDAGISPEAATRQLTEGNRRTY